MNGTGFSGGCACGAIRYSVSGAPRYMGNCHCRDCQQATGGAYLPAVGVRDGEFALEKGAPTWFDRTADRGHTVRRAFCPDCGSPMFVKNTINPDFTVIYAGSLNDPSWYTPGLDIFVKSAQPWNPMHPDVPKIDAMPAGPGQK